jgi:flagellar biosynthetic protein FlhB
VIAKGIDELAIKIREIAMEHKVVIMEAPPLARALYRHTELGDEIPAPLYSAVAQILAYVFQLRSWRQDGDIAPVYPDYVDVPADMDPLNSEIKR